MGRLAQYNPTWMGPPIPRFVSHRCSRRILCKRVDQSDGQWLRSVCGPVPFPVEDSLTVLAYGAPALPPPGLRYGFDPELPLIVWEPATETAGLPSTTHLEMAH